MAVEFDLESSLLEPVQRHLYSNGVRKMQSELQFYDYRLDIYGYSPSRDATYAVELKLKKWRRAFEQALIYQLCADFVSLALPMSATTVVDIELLEHHGIGLIGVQSERRCIRLLAPKQSKSVRTNYKTFYVDLIQGAVVCR
jgi:hypothetical protein